MMHPRGYCIHIDPPLPQVGQDGIPAPFLLLHLPVLLLLLLLLPRRRSAFTGELCP